MSSLTLLLSFIVFSFFLPSVADPPRLAADKSALLDFAAATPHARLLNWDPSTSPCLKWTGVSCNADGSRVVALRLPGFGFVGPIRSETLARLSALQILSLRFNAFDGSLPSDLANLSSLTALHLQNNHFSGNIPPLISNLTRLVTLNLASNSLSGEIPDLQLPSLKFLNLSYNHFTGSIPSSLLRFPDSSFAGNKISPFPPIITASPLPPSKKLSEGALLGIIAAGCALGFAALAVSTALCCLRLKKESMEVVTGGKAMKGKWPMENMEAVSQEGNNTLVFFNGSTLAFDLEDLLRASAEVLGKGTFGAAYKAVLEDGTTVVVKRLKEVGVGRKEFELQMEVVGRIRHENVAELRAYYYSKDEKLMVYDYFSQGSVYSLLHGKRGEDRVPLDWETRLNIALGAAVGIAHIHTQNNGKLAHGNIKSSNIFLNEQQFGCVSDLGLAAAINSTALSMSRTAGYRAPEITETRKPSQLSDVYSFGVVLLELLTGKPAIQIVRGGDEIIHLVRWVQSVVREEWTAEVFDVQLLRYPNIEEEMVEMLQIAMACVVRVPEKRPQMSQVVKMIGDVRKFDSINWLSTEARDD
ncbi:hypothetical protein IEQ34_018590 [Dendrobium chrysotoxum]|uniref:Protein kinase domain-containing protein n=1 Tax=Dendrobium chrysotoxum TaxID=161865 RepID=A0AAV7G4G7_DENCH|nr:hypothetical protein IEQ34_018590 [Dendrobium chrysotoxum]